MTGRVDAGGDLAERPPFARLHRQNMQPPHQVGEHAAQFQFAAFDQQWPDHLLRQPGAVLGADRGKVAPDFANPSAPSRSVTFRNSAGRSRIMPNEVRIGIAIGVRTTRASIRSMRSRADR